MVFTTLGIIMIGTDITRTIIMDIIIGIQIVSIIIHIIITTDTTITMVITITQNHVDTDTQHQMRWVEIGTTTNHIIKRIVVGM